MRPIQFYRSSSDGPKARLAGGRTQQPLGLCHTKLAGWAAERPAFSAPSLAEAVPAVTPPSNARTRGSAAASGVPAIAAAVPDAPSVPLVELVVESASAAVRVEGALGPAGSTLQGQASARGVDGSNETVGCLQSLRHFWVLPQGRQAGTSSRQKRSSTSGGQKELACTELDDAFAGLVNLAHEGGAALALLSLRGRGLWMLQAGGGGWQFKGEKHAHVSDVGREAHRQPG